MFVSETIPAPGLLVVSGKNPWHGKLPLSLSGPFVQVLESIGPFTQTKGPCLNNLPSPVGSLGDRGLVVHQETEPLKLSFGSVRRASEWEQVQGCEHALRSVRAQIAMNQRLQSQQSRIKPWVIDWGPRAKVPNLCGNMNPGVSTTCPNATLMRTLAKPQRKSPLSGNCLVGESAETEKVSFKSKSAPDPCH